MTSALDYQDRAWLGGPSLDPGWLDPAGTNPDGLDRALQPFGYSRMLPSAAYTSPEVLAWERRYLFAATWTCVGREADLRQSSGAGGEVTQRALLVGDVPVLLTLMDRQATPDPLAETPVFRQFCRCVEAQTALSTGPFAVVFIAGAAPGG